MKPDLFRSDLNRRRLWIPGSAARPRDDPEGVDTVEAIDYALSIVPVFIAQPAMTVALGSLGLAPERDVVWWTVPANDAHPRANPLSPHP